MERAARPSVPEVWNFHTFHTETAVMTKTKQAPSLKLHKKTGHAYARFNARQIWFGRFDDSETHRSFATFLARWEANGRELPEDREASSLTVAELVAAYLKHSEVYYRKPDGTPTHEIVNIRCTARPLLELFGSLSVEDFDLRCLKRYRERLVDSGLCRWTVNDRVCRVVRVFGWGTEEETVPPATFGSLRALKPLKRGRSRAPETEPIQPVSWEHVEAVLELVPSTVRAMILLQWYTGMRPGEVVQLRSADLDRSGESWIYRPCRHKTEHHGRERMVLIGPRAQETLRPFLLQVPRPDPVPLTKMNLG